MAATLEFGHQLLKRDSSKEFIAILNGWRKAMDKYSVLQQQDDGTPGDVAYWYGERANISFLAAGAWLSGPSLSEEFASKKIRSRKKTNGRIDLYICGEDLSVDIESSIVTSMQIAENSPRTKLRRLWRRRSRMRGQLMVLQIEWPAYSSSPGSQPSTGAMSPLSATVQS